jgi:hypothetical protein
MMKIAYYNVINVLSMKSDHHLEITWIMISFSTTLICHRSNIKKSDSHPELFPPQLPRAPRQREKCPVNKISRNSQSEIVIFLSPASTSSRTLKCFDFQFLSPASTSSRTLKCLDFQFLSPASTSSPTASEK